MINLIVNFLFFIVNSLYTIILSPVFLGINALLPGDVNFIEHITDFLSQALTYISTIASLLCIPASALTLVVTFFETKFLMFALIKVRKIIAKSVAKIKTLKEIFNDIFYNSNFNNFYIISYNFCL